MVVSPGIKASEDDKGGLAWVLLAMLSSSLKRCLEIIYFPTDVRNVHREYMTRITFSVEEILVAKKIRPLCLWWLAGGPQKRRLQSFEALSLENVFLARINHLSSIPDSCSGTLPTTSHGYG